MKKILIVVGTRPNFIKITQFPGLISNYYSNKLECKIVHTGQHFEDTMSQIFFDQLQLNIDYYLSALGVPSARDAYGRNVPPGSADKQMAEITLRLEQLITNKYRPDLLMVVGDVNSTLAAAKAAKTMGIRLAHVESGLRSFDLSMPEEMNRILTDKIADLLFVTEQSGMDNLLKEGKSKESIHFVGNTMIDTLVGFQKEIQSADILAKKGLKNGQFILMTMHRPATVDNKDMLSKLVELIEVITVNQTLVFPIHPRTKSKMKNFNLADRIKPLKNLILTEPLDYFSFQKLICSGKLVITDSGGIQEETTWYQVPCLTLRPNTERPSTIKIGSNELIPFDIKTINKLINNINNNHYKKGKIPPLWDGKATERILEILSEP